jgi:Fe-S-cluster containining protein
VPEVNVEIQIRGQSIKAAVDLPAEPIRPVDLLRVIQGFSDAIVSATAAGQHVTCKKGCSACCYQVIPISETEAIGLVNLIEQMTPDRKAAITARFTDAVKRLKSAGILDRLSPHALNDTDLRRAVSKDYFAAGIPCPFLENGSCSIYDDRPLSCREYLAVTPPENCSHPFDGDAQTLAMPRSLSTVLFRFGDGIGNDAFKLVPLVLLFERASAPQPSLPGVQLFENFIRALMAPEESTYAGV